jgi:hypothetical protein
MHDWPGLATLDVRGLRAQHQQADEEQRLLAVSAVLGQTTSSKIQGRTDMMRLGPLGHVRWPTYTIVTVYGTWTYLQCLRLRQSF